MNIEVIEFTAPTSNRKNLFVTNIPPIEEDTLYNLLYEAFSKFGLLHEIQIFSSKLKDGSKRKTTTGKSTTSAYYSFIKFYSYMSAQSAKESLNEKLTIEDIVCKVAYARRTKGDNSATPFQLQKCYALANYYLGFNGWSSKVKMMEEDKDVVQTADDLCKVRIFCHVMLEVTNQNLSCDGIGVWEQTYAKNDPPRRAGALAQARKVSHNRAMQHAFSKLLIVSLANGKVWVEVNTTLEEQFLQENTVDEGQLLKVTELNEEPVPEDENLLKADNMDDVNLQILQELEDPI